MVRTSPRLQLAADMAGQAELRRREGDAAMESSASGGHVADVAAGGAGGVTHERNDGSGEMMAEAERVGTTPGLGGTAPDLGGVVVQGAVQR